MSSSAALAPKKQIATGDKQKQQFWQTYVCMNPFITAMFDTKHIIFSLLAIGADGEHSRDSNTLWMVQHIWVCKLTMHIAL